MPRQIVTINYGKRQWMHTMIYHYRLFGDFPTDTFQGLKRQEIYVATKDNDYMR